MSLRTAVAVVLAAVLAGCATEPPASAPGEAGPHATAPGAAPDPLPGYERDEVYTGPVYVADPAAGEAAVAALGTPFYIVFKAAVCAGSLAIAAPTSALIAISGRETRREGIEVLGAGVAQNCGPPYVLTR